MPRANLSAMFDVNKIKMTQNAKFLFVPTRWPNLFRPIIYICLLASLNIDSLCSVCSLVLGVWSVFTEPFWRVSS